MFVRIWAQVVESAIEDVSRRWEYVRSRAHFLFLKVSLYGILNQNSNQPAAECTFKVFF